MPTLKVGHHYLTRGGHAFTVLMLDPRMSNTTNAFLCSDQRTRSREGKWADGPAAMNFDAFVEVTITPIDAATTINTPPVVTSLQHKDLCNVLHAIINGIPDDDLRGVARTALNNYSNEHLPTRS